MKNFNLNCFDIQSKEVSPCFLKVLQNGTEIEMNLYFKNTKFIAKGTSPYETFFEIRRELEIQGFLILCKGSREDITYSGMTLPSFMVYQIEIGKPAKKLVHMFDKENNLIKVSTLNKQLEYRDKWLKSLLNICPLSLFERIFKIFYTRLS